VNRRDFLKTGAMPAAINNLTAQTSDSAEKQLINKHRVLGTGNAAFEVSALGFGCMGMRQYIASKLQATGILPIRKNWSVIENACAG
jgi:hypothetical protein